VKKAKGNLITVPKSLAGHKGKEKLFHFFMTGEEN